MLGYLYKEQTKFELSGSKHLLCRFKEALPYLWYSYNQTLQGATITKANLLQEMWYLSESTFHLNFLLIISPAFWGAGDCAHAMALINQALKETNYNKETVCFAAHMAGHCTKHTPDALALLGQCMCDGYPNCKDSPFKAIGPGCSTYQIVVAWQGILPPNVVRHTLFRGGDRYGSGYAKSVIKNTGIPMPMEYVEKDSYIIEFSDT